MKCTLCISLIALPFLGLTQNCYKFVDGLASFKAELNNSIDNNVPGFALQLLHKDSTVLSFTSGKANLTTGTLINQETPFYIASVAKTMTAAAVLLLSQERKLKLQDYVHQYISGLPSATKSIRIYHLLTHLSGLPDYYDIYGENLQDFYNKNVLEFAYEIDSLKFEPGVSYSYSNTAYVLLALIVEKISRQTLSEFLNTRFFNPLGMHQTRVIDKPGLLPEDRAIGYKVDSNGSYSVLDYEGVYTTGAGGVYSTTEDLKKWILGLNNGKILSKRNVQLMFDFPTTYSGAKSYFGMGWNNESYGPKTPDINGLKSYGSFGVMKGFRSAIILFPDIELTIILLGNSTQLDLLSQKVIKHFIRKSEGL